MLLEEQALDSFANLVFGVANFWREVGEWPEMVTVVSHGFKEGRFLELHVPAMRWSRERVSFVGVDPEYMVEDSVGFDGERCEGVRRGERERGFGEWEKDLMGKGERLRGKRRERNPWKVSQLFFESEEERDKSGVKSEVLRGEVVEEVLVEGRQPWEGTISV